MELVDRLREDEAPVRSEYALRVASWMSGFLVLVALLRLGAAGWAMRHTVVLFDDSLMFYRYAVHIRGGLGASWNLDGVHTYGETSLLWGCVVLLLSYLPLRPEQALVVGSLVSSVAALAAMSWAIARSARSRYFQGVLRVAPLVVLPLLLLGRIFLIHAVTGMETMLATTLAAVYLGTVLLWVRGQARSSAVVLAGVLLFLTRPDSGIVVLLTPMLAFWGLRDAEGQGALRFGDLVRVLCGVLTCVVCELLVCKLYFHTALPLAFYMKSQHGYEGYVHSWTPITSAINLLAHYCVYLLLLAVAARRTDLKLMAVCLIPALATFGYLFTITQIMGLDARYYLPYISFFVVPALLMVDRRVATGRPWVKGWPIERKIFAVAGVAVVLVLMALYRRPDSRLLVWMERSVENRPYAYDTVDLRTDATVPLPNVGWSEALEAVGDTLVKPLPGGATAAASEVGYLGVVAPDVNIIDMEGLNDSQIALHGFSVAALLARKPDVIWMPHTDYTYQQGLLLSDPGLLEQYVVYAGAANYGVAIRKDSAERTGTARSFAAFWKRLYPGYSMQEYVVRSASWSGRKYRATGNTQVETH